MPSAWPAEALKAQAIAARSYALANLQKGASFDLYGDSRSQVYGGVAAETPATDAAVDATKGQVVLYAGKVADTLFFSTSGGRTASAADATGQAVPYLVPVSDPYDTASPYHDWGPVLVTAGQVTKLLKLPGAVQGVAVQGLQAALGSDGRVRSLEVLGADGTGIEVTGAQARLDLGLRSTWFTPTLLSLAKPTKPMTYGGATPLTGFVRGAQGGAVSTAASPVDLESRVGAGAWQTAAQPALGTDGSFSAVVHPPATTQYRLSWGSVRVGLATVGVAPLVTATFATGSATGSIRPAVAGAPVELQWSPDGATWQTVGQATTDSTGAFSVAGSGTDSTGSYRVRVAPGHGLVPGYAQPS
jgi:SpoIID/LytB domain protein